MARFQTLGPAVAALAMLALPVMAAGTMDAAKMTCKDYGAMDSAGMMSATKAMKEAAATDKMADPAKAKMSDEEITKMVMADCKGKPEMMVMDTMHKK